MDYHVGEVLVHPEDDPQDPAARRLIARAATHGDWPWMRLTGLPVDIPHRDVSLTHWHPQPLHEVAKVLEP